MSSDPVLYTDADVELVAAAMDLDRFVTPIPSGLTATRFGGLSKQRAAQLDRRLRGLDAARSRAWLEIRSYPISTGEDRHDP